ncbi:Inner membrane protein YdcO [Andreprevotia sp. IGB-42]|nr:Inner membrane protein YdcO [Andreprevotia sp. IGB-42]
MRVFPFSAVVAGFVTVLVGFTSSAVIVFQAAQALGASPAEVASWMWALGLAMGLSCIGLSLRYKVPIVTAWSTPGAAMLVTSVAGVPMAEAVGAFMVSALLIALAGFSGVFERAMARVPLGMASAMLAGVLLRFGMGAFGALQTQFVMVGAMLAMYLLLRRLLPRYAIVGVLATGIVVAALQGQLHLSGVHFALATPVFTVPALSWHALIGVALPLFVVTMASQNIPGVAVLRASCYHPPISPVIGTTGVINLLLAPFGAFALNLAAITAAICMGPEAHEDAKKRYLAAVSAGVFYLLVGIFGATVGALFAAFPKELVLAVAGFALINTIGGGLLAAVRDEHQREPALITFLVTASGLTLFGIGAAFWGLLAGGLATVVLQYRRQAA